MAVPKIDIAPSELKEVQCILAAHVPECEVRAFGSRAKRTAWEHSDLDLALICDKPIGLDTIGRLQDAFEESDLRFRVDVVDYLKADGYIQQAVNNDGQLIQQPPPPDGR